MTKTMASANRSCKIKATTFLAFVSNKTCLKTHACSTQTCSNKPQRMTSSNKLKTHVYQLKQQLFQLWPNPSNIHHVDAIESIARKNIVSALGTGESVPKSVFALTAIINRWSPA